jgi:protein involved in polysaccharide export with SLBB domain
MLKKVLAFCLLFSALAALSAQSKLDIIENMQKKSNAVGSSTDAQRLPDAQLAMSVSYYPVTAGDIYTLAFVVGTNPISYSIPVDSTYQMRIANLGVINCAGLTYLQLKNQVEQLVLRNYPMGGVQFVLTQPSTFLVSVTGEVKQTVEQDAWALTRLSTIIKQNFTNYSSHRNITIKSTSGRTRKYDLFKAERDGDLSQDPFLRPGDKIIVNRLERQVSISGAVERPGTYELLEGENLKELIEKYGGGLAPLADPSRIELYRKVSGKEDSGNKSYLNKKSIEDNAPLSCYDSVFIASYEELTPVVFVEGAISTTIETQETSTTPEGSTIVAAKFNLGEDYAYFVRRNKDWFIAESDLSNAYVNRAGQIIKLNLNDMLYDASYRANVEMKPNDTLIIPFRQYFVTVAGAVTNPGRFPYIPDRDYEYYVGLAGGFTSSNAHDAVLLTDINGKKYSKKELITPETTITAKSNSFFYNWNRYAPTITTVLSIVVSALSIYVTSQTL